MTMQHCDVLLAVGARFDDRVIGNPKHFASVERKIIHVDIDPSSISKRVKVDIPIVGDVKEVLRELIAQIREAQARPDAAALGAWWSQIAEWRGRECLKYRNSDEVIKPQYVVETLARLTRGSDAYVTSRRRPAPDVGRAVLPVRAAAPLDQFRRPRHDGRGPALRHGHQARQARRGRVLRHRRGLDPDVHPGAFHLPAVPHAGEDRLAEQPLPRHGAAVAAARLRAAATRTATWTRCPTSSSSPRPMATSAC